MRYFLLLFISCSLQTFGQYLPNKAKFPPKWMIDLANRKGLEVVYGDRVPYINPFGEGNFGSPVIQGYLKSDEKVWINKKKNIFSFKLIPYYIFFLRKKKGNHKLDLSKDANPKINYLDYYNSFDYYLAFVINNNDNYEVKGIYEYYFIGLQGYYWEYRDEWKEFTKLAKKRDNQDYLTVYEIKQSEIQNDFPIASYSDMGYTVYIIYNYELYIYHHAYPEE